MIESCKRREGKLDVLVNNSGLGVVRHRFDEFPLDDFDGIQAVNVRGIFALTKECLPVLAEASSSGDHASVINIGSIDDIRIPSDNDWAYGLGKAAVHHLTRQWASRMGNRGGRKGGHNITFNAVAPGPFPGMLDEVLKDPETRAVIAGVTSVGGIGEPEDMAGVCIYLASRAWELACAGPRVPGAGGSTGPPAKHCGIDIQSVATGSVTSSRLSASCCPVRPVESASSSALLSAAKASPPSTRLLTSAVPGPSLTRAPAGSAPCTPGPRPSRAAACRR